MVPDSLVPKSKGEVAPVLLPESEGEEENVYYSPYNPSHFAPAYDPIYYRTYYETTIECSDVLNRNFNETLCLWISGHRYSDILV